MKIASKMNKFCSLLALLALLVVASGCGASAKSTGNATIPKKGEYNVYETKSDNLERKSIVRTIFFHNDNLFQIGIRQFVDLSSNEKIETVVVRYMGRSWLFLNGDVNINIDGKLNKFKDDNPIRFTRGGSRYSEVGVTEEVVVHVQKGTLKQMAIGKEVGIYFIGTPVYLNEKEKSFILRFYNENIQ